MLANLFTSLGLTRDDALWVWLQVIGAATIVANGVIDVHQVALDYFAVNLTPLEIRWIVLLCGLIGIVGGRMGTSGLAGAKK